MTFLPPRVVNLSVRMRHTHQYALFRTIAAFIGLCMVLFLPFALVQGARTVRNYISTTKGTIAEHGKEALTTFSGGLMALQRSSFLEAQDYFQRTSTALEDAGNVLASGVKPWQKIVALFPGYNQKLHAAQALLHAATVLTSIASSSASAVSLLASVPSAQDRIVVLSQAEGVFTRILPLWEELRTTLAPISSTLLPREIQSEFEELRKNLPSLHAATKESSTLVQILKETLGEHGKKRYAIVFQNNAELRPTGGFMGSLAMIEVSRGRITSLEVPKGGIYDIAGQIHTRVIAPKPLWLVNANWNIQDANWFPDFPTSARKFLWFWNQSGWPPLDGIITFTPTLFEELMRVIGPIGPVAPINTMLNAENVVATIQELTSLQPHETTTPKEFLAHLVPLVLERMTTLKGNAPSLLIGVGATAISSKQLLFYMTDQKLQKIIEQFHAAGSLAPFQGDYLAIVHANIRGNKTDRVIRTSVERTAMVHADGSVDAAVTLKRSHEGVKGVKFTGMRNYTYMRFYVPKGSVLVNSKGFSEPPVTWFETPDPSAVPDPDLARIEKDAYIDARFPFTISEEFGKTVFGAWTIIDPGETTTLSVDYSTPPQPFPYRLLWQKQPGAEPISFTSTVVAPSHPKNPFTWQGFLDQDMIQEAL